MMQQRAKNNFNIHSYSTLKGILRKYGKDLTVLADEAGVYYLAYPPTEKSGTPELFAAIAGMSGNIYLYLWIFNSSPGLVKYIPQRLLRYLDTEKHCFCFSGLITGYEDDLRNLFRLAKQLRSPNY